MLLEVAAVVGDAVRVLEAPQEPDLLEDVLPLLQRLLPAVGHLLDGHHLCGDIVPGVVDGAEGPMADLAKVVEQLVRVLALEQLRHVGVLQAARPGSKNGNR